MFVEWPHVFEIARVLLHRVESVLHEPLAATCHELKRRHLTASRAVCFFHHRRHLRRVHLKSLHERCIRRVFGPVATAPLLPPVVPPPPW